VLEVLLTVHCRIWLLNFSVGIFLRLPLSDQDECKIVRNVLKESLLGMDLLCRALCIDCSGTAGSGIWDRGQIVSKEATHKCLEYTQTLQRSSVLLK
jgi:hypothetical protein